MKVNCWKNDESELLEIFKDEPPHPSYIAGLIDGDGCIFIRKITDGYQSGISISQSRTNVLQILRHHFGGSITSSTNRNNHIYDEKKDEENTEFYDKFNKRNQYNWIIRSNEYSLFLSYIRNFIIIKKRQMECLLKMKNYIHKPNLDDEKKQLYELCKSQNKNGIKLIESNIEISIEYIQGLFDAEGCFYIGKKDLDYYIKISQKNHPEILQKIKEKLGFGNIYKEIYICIYNKKDCLQFIQWMKMGKGLIIKYRQMISFETFLETNDINVKKEMYRICNEEKHRVEQFDDLNQSDKGKEAYLQKMAFMEIHQKAFQEIRKRKQYQEKSIMMMGELNHNYGKSKSEEVKKKMSIAKKLNKGISDTIILQVRAFLDEGLKNVDIEKKLGIGRHVVTRIKNGELICINEEKKELHKMTIEEQAISKRKVDMEEICLIIDKCMEDWKPTSILKLLQENREKQNKDKESVTIDIVKNVKRKWNEKKCPLYPTEERYHEYMEKIKNIK
jgi:hypothetical protein